MRTNQIKPKKNPIVALLGAPVVAIINQKCTGQPMPFGSHQESPVFRHGECQPMISSYI